MTVTLIWRTDVHLSDHTPRSRLDNWSDTVLAKLSRVGELAKVKGAQAVLDGGDFFDIKSPVRNSHSLVRRAMEVHRSYPCPVYANVGNHDCVYGDYSFLHQQPLGVLFEAGTFRRLYDHHELILTKGGVKVRVVGIPYHGTSYDLERLRAITRGDEDYLVVVAHLLASPKVTTMFESEDVIRYDYLDDYPVDVWCFGHWHKDQGITQTPKGKMIVNIGSLTRGSLTQDDCDRTPSVAVLEFTGSGFTAVKVPIGHEPAEKVFDVLGRDVAVLRQDRMDEFAESLKLLPNTATAIPLLDKVRDLPGIPTKIKELLISYVEKAERK